jgi:hypothetical protein
MAKLTYQARKNLPSGSFVEPGKRKYPIPDASHARNALSRVSQFGSPAEKAKVDSAVHKKFPGIGKKPAPSANLNKSLLLRGR